MNYALVKVGRLDLPSIIASTLVEIAALNNTDSELLAMAKRVGRETAFFEVDVDYVESQLEIAMYLADITNKLYQEAMQAFYSGLVEGQAC